jgi:hypothetical protein
MKMKTETETKTVYNATTGKNEDKITITETILGYTIKERSFWEEITKSTIIKKGTYRIRIEGKWKANFGKHAIDWIPNLTLPKN